MMTPERLKDCMAAFAPSDNLIGIQLQAIAEMEAEIRRCWGVIDRLVETHPDGQNAMFNIEYIERDK